MSSSNASRDGEARHCLVDDDACLTLTAHERGVLHGLWLLCAKLECDGLWPRLPANTRYLSRELGLRVKAADIAALADSYVIEIVDSAKLREWRASGAHPHG